MIFAQITHQLEMLSKLLSQISDEAYTQQIIHLDHATIGGHSRHIIELIKIITDGYEKGEVDYLNRKRNLLLETNRHFAINTIQELNRSVEHPDKPFLIATESSDEVLPLKTQSSYYREIVYGTEHTIHHFALLKVALVELNIKINEPDFGIAYATIQYRKNLSSTSVSQMS